MGKADINVYKIGGSVLNSAQDIKKLVSCLKPGIIPGRTVMVHGGGNAISRCLKETGIEPVFIDGQRVTDAKTMRSVEMVLSGLANKEMVSIFRAEGISAVGISGRDGGLAVAEIVDPRLGYVGKVKKVDPSLLFALLERGFVPVLSPVSNSASGEALNVNADFFACEIAIALKAKGLNLITASGGVIKDNDLIKELPCSEIQELMRGGIVTAGMIPKLQAAAEAIAGGVEKVNLLDYKGSIGTCIT